MLLPDDVRCDLSSVVIDTMGIFWTLGRKNELQKQLMDEWELNPRGFDIDVFVPSESLEKYQKRNIKVKPLSVPVGSVDGYKWCELFGIDIISSPGVLIIRAIEGMKNRPAFSFDEIIDEVKTDELSDTLAKGAVVNLFMTAASWGIFAKESEGIDEIVRGGSISVIDVSTVKSDVVRSAVVSYIASNIYHMRIEARRSYERRLMGDMDVAKGIPMVWLFIDEAQKFLPSNGKTLATDILLNEWLKQGRQPGLSLVMATQRPSSIHQDVLSQSDIVMCHRLTSREDIEALESVRPTYMRDNFADAIMKMGSEKGVALVIDDNTEAVHLIRLRPRLSWHGGDDPAIICR